MPGQEMIGHKAQNRELVGMGKAVRKLPESTEGWKGNNNDESCLSITRQL